MTFTSRSPASAFIESSDRRGGNVICLILLLLSLVLSGCGTITTIDINESDLMPKSVAMSIFEKYGFKQWAEKPFMSMIGSTEKEFIAYNQIESALYSRTQNRLELVMSSGRKQLFLDQALMVTFPHVTESQALELTKALRALGATKIDRLKWGL